MLYSAGQRVGLFPAAFAPSLFVAYAALKLYDLPVRTWMGKLGIPPATRNGASAAVLPRGRASDTMWRCQPGAFTPLTHPDILNPIQVVS